MSISPEIDCYRREELCDLDEGGNDVILEVPRVVVVDTVGAGDSFSGGFLAQWQSRGLGRADVANLDEVLSAARFGIAVAAITCQRPGADPPNVQEMKVH